MRRPYPAPPKRAPSDLLVYDQPLPEVFTDQPLPEVFTDQRRLWWSFQALPFVIVPAGAPDPPGVTPRRLENYPLDRLVLLVGLDWLLTVECDVVSLSIGPRGKFDELDPLQIATRTFVARSRIVVVAAGNYGPAPQSLQMLARAAWVVSVAAVTDDLEPVESSSRGGGPLPGPTFAGYGSNPFDPAEVGTSFAAPRVAHAAAFALKSLSLMIADLQAHCGSGPKQWSPPIALPWIGFADTGWDPKKAPYQWGPIAAGLLPDESSIEIESTAAQHRWASKFIKAIGRTPIPPVSPAMVVAALKLAAKPLDYDPTIVGWGLVTLENTFNVFRRLTPPRVGALLGFAGHEALVRLDDEMGVYWGPDRTGVTEDAFGSGIRFSVARVKEK